MPHIPGHIQNSFLRLVRKTRFTKSVGVLYPIYTGKTLLKKEIVQRGKLDYPILFFNNKGTELSYGQKVAFLPIIVGKRDGKYLIVATNAVDYEIHKLSDLPGNVKDTSYPPKVQKIINSIKDADTKYEKSDSYDIIYCGGKGNGAKNRLGAKRKLSDNEVVEWIVKNAISFDDMNLATN